MDIEDATPSVNFISCVKWVKKGVAKEIPEKVQLTEEELQDIISQTKTDLSIVEEDEGNTQTETNPTSGTADDEYHFDKYDEEDEKPDVLMGIGNIAVYASNTGDPYVTVGGDEDEDSEKEDDLINPKDNLILVGHVEGDACILEVYVHNEEEGSLYVHHDLLLPAFPLCIEWLNHDPGDRKPGNLCAVGSMSPVIEVWDIDVVDCLEPVFKLGHRANKKKGIAKYGHRDAVLDLSWNTNVTHVMASGSADRTVLLWDLDSGKFASTLSSFQEKIQSLQWHPFEGQTLLTGSCDKFARVFDCRVEDSHKDWQVPGEVEQVQWDHFNPFNFLVGTSTGSIHYVDCRIESPLWELGAHEKEVTGLALSSQCPGLMVSAGAEGYVKTWDISSGNPTLVYSKEESVGSLLCMDTCPDLPFVVCVGGDKKSHNFSVIDLMDNSAAQHKFANRDLVRPVFTSEDGTEAAGVETADVMFESLSLDAQPSTSRAPMISFLSSGHKSREKKKMRRKKKL